MHFLKTDFDKVGLSSTSRADISVFIIFGAFGANALISGSIRTNKTPRQMKTREPWAEACPAAWKAWVVWAAWVATEGLAASVSSTTLSQY